MFGPASVTTTVASTIYVTEPIVLDYLKYGVTAVAVVRSVSTSTGVYNIETTLGTPTSSDTSGLTWFSSGSSNITGETLMRFDYPAQAIRLNVTLGASLSALTMTVIQSG